MASRSLHLCRSLLAALLCVTWIGGGCVSGDFKDDDDDAGTEDVPDGDTDGGRGPPADAAAAADTLDLADVAPSPCDTPATFRCVVECGAATSFEAICGLEGWECPNTAPIDARTCGTCTGLAASCCDDDGRVLAEQLCVEGDWTCSSGAAEACASSVDCPGEAPADCVTACGIDAVRLRECRDSVWQCPVGLLSIDDCPPACEGDTPVCCDAEGAVITDAYCIGITWRCDEPTSLDTCGMLAPPTLTGAYVETQWLDCSGVRAETPSDPIASLLFYGGDEFELTFQSHEGLFRDYWGTATYDPGTGQLRMTATGGANRLTNTDLDGMVVQLPDGTFEFRDMWLGTSGDDPALAAAHCGHVLRRLGGGG